MLKTEANEKQEIGKDDKNLCFIFYDGILYVSDSDYMTRERKEKERKERVRNKRSRCMK